MNILLLILFFLILIIVLWALLGKSEKGEKEDDTGESSSLFRRRAADLEIEKEFPDKRKKSQDSERQRRKTDDREFEGEGPETGKEDEDKDDHDEILHAGDDLDLPFTADEIISDTSRFKIYKRTLLNAEIYAQKSDFSTAISLYEGVNSRISDTETNNKIEVNIDYLKQYREQLKIKKREKRLEKKSKAQAQKPNEIKLSIDGPLSIPENVQIGIAPLQSFTSPQLDITRIMGEIAKNIAEVTAQTDRSPRDVEFKRIVQEIDYLKDDVVDLNRKVKKAAENTQIRDTENTGLKEDLKNLTSSIKTLNNEKDNVSKKFDNIKSEIQASGHADSLDQETLNKRNSDINELEEHAADLEEKLKSITGNVDKIGSTSGNLKKEIKKLANEIKNLAWEKDSIELDLMNLRSSFQNPAKYPNVGHEIRQKSIGQIDELAEVTGDLGTKIDETAESIKKIDSESSASHNILEDLKSEIGRIASDRDRVRQELFNIKNGAQGPIVQSGADLQSSLPPKAEPQIPMPPPVEEVTAPPGLTQAKFTAPPLPEAAPGNLPFVPIQVPPPGPMNYPYKDKPEEKRGPGDKLDRHDGREEFNRQRTEKEEELVEGEEQFELLSEYEKEEKGEAEIPSDKLSDDDIFEKIIKDDDRKIDKEAFEIIGDTRREAEYAYDFSDEDFERKQHDEMKFYQKFLRHNKRKKRELPILKVTYDFTRLPDEFSLSRDKNILEYSFYRYKPMLERANDFVQDRRVRDAINYYKVVMSQNIPPEFKSMIKRNINDLTEYLEKYLATG